LRRIQQSLKRITNGFGVASLDPGIPDRAHLARRYSVR